MLWSAYKQHDFHFMRYETVHIKLTSASAQIRPYGGSIKHPVITNVTPNLAFCFKRAYLLQHYVPSDFSNV